jgi:hypothetical protein
MQNPESLKTQVKLRLHLCIIYHVTIAHCNMKHQVSLGCERKRFWPKYSFKFSHIYQGSERLASMQESWRIIKYMSDDGFWNEKIHIMKIDGNYMDSNFLLG